MIKNIFIEIERIDENMIDENVIYMNSRLLLSF